MLYQLSYSRTGPRRGGVVIDVGREGFEPPYS